MNKWIFFGLFFFSACAADPPPSGAWDEAVNDFGLYIEEAIREDFPERVDEVYDYQGLSRLIIRKSRVKDVETMQVVARAAQKDRFIGQAIRRMLLELGAEFRYVKQYYEEDFYHVVFEMSSPTGIFNYIDFTVEPQPETGEMRIIDVYNFLDGIASSDLYADILKMVADRGITNQEVLAAMQDLKQIDELLYAGQQQEALEVFDSLSILFRQRALFLKRKIKILTFFSDRETLRDSVREYESLYPEDTKFLNFIKIYLTDDPAEQAKWAEGLRKYIEEERAVEI